MKKIKIAIIAHNCRGGGAMVGMLNLLKVIKNLAQHEQFLLVCPAGYGYEDVDFPAGSEFFVYKGSHSPFARYWFETVTLPKIVERYKPDVIFGPGNIGLANPNVPQVLFIKQAYLFYGKKYYPGATLQWRLRIWALKSQIKKSLPKTDLILCQTTVVQSRFCDVFSYPKEKTKVLAFPPPKEIVHKPDIETPGVFGQSSDSFFVFLPTVHMAHRNPDILIPFCERYCETIRERKIKFLTTLEPFRSKAARRFLQKVDEMKLGDIIINVGELDRKQMAAFLNHSDILWLPTLLECLSTVYLEAMLVGLPIMAPDLDFARYTCDDAAVYYNPWKLDSIFDTIISLHGNALLREELVCKGKHQLAKRDKFPKSWDNFALEIIETLKRIAKKN